MNRSKVHLLHSTDPTSRKACYLGKHLVWAVHVPQLTQQHSQLRQRRLQEEFVGRTKTILPPSRAMTCPNSTRLLPSSKPNHPSLAELNANPPRPSHMHNKTNHHPLLHQSATKSAESKPKLDRLCSFQIGLHQSRITNHESHPPTLLSLFLVHVQRHQHTMFDSLRHQCFASPDP